MKLGETSSVVRFRARAAFLQYAEGELENYSAAIGVVLYLDGGRAVYSDN